MSIGFHLIVAGSTLLDGILLLLILFGLPGASSAAAPRVIGMGRLGAAFIVATMLFLIRLVPFTVLGVHIFGIMRLVYVGLVITVPLVSFLLLLARWRADRRRLRITGALTSAAVLGLFGAPVGVYASWYELYNLQLETATVSLGNSPTMSKPLRIGVIADVQTDHIGDYERRAFHRIAAERPDIVLMPGDMFQGTPRQLEASADALRTMLMTIDAAGGAFFVEGDCGADDWLDPILAGTPVRYLRNEIVETAVGNTRVFIAGIALQYASSAATRTIQRLIDIPRHRGIRILLAHRPDVVTQLPPDADIDLVVAGHTHGGQVVIPWFGPPVTFSALPRHICAGGLHEWMGTALYISRGVGHERGQAPRLRFLCPPEVSLLTLQD